MLSLLLVPALLASPSTWAGSTQDEDSVKELRSAFKKEKKADERAALLGQLARRGAADSEDAEDAWDAIADAMKDDSFVVRRAALGLLKKTPRRADAVKPLTDALNASLIEAVKAGAGGSGGGAARGGRGGNPLAGFFGGKDDDKKQKPKISKEDAEAQEAQAEEAASGEYFKEIIAAVSELPDDRSVKALSKYFEGTQGRGMGELQLASGQALAKLGTKGALETVRRVLDKVAVLAAAEQKMAARGGGAGGRQEGPSSLQIAQGLHEALRAAATRAELDGAPDYDDDVARNWKKFLSSNSKALPAKLGKIED